MYNEMSTYKIALYRGGTSKAIFIKENELHKDLETRNKIIRAIFGSPDKRQIDGLGGADVLTSKLAIIGPATKEGTDIDYTFAQVSFDDDKVDYGGNCGNISAAVGSFAINEGMIEVREPYTTVKIHQTNTNCVLIADVPVKGGKALIEGDCSIDGVPGTSAAIYLDFFDTQGSSTGHILPTGNVLDTIKVEGYGNIDVSIVDAGNVVVFVEAQTLGLKGSETTAEIESNKDIMKKIEAIRSTCAVNIGMAKSREESTRNPYVPFFSIVSEPSDYICVGNTRKINKENIDIVARLNFMLHMHKTYPGTGTVATGAAARIEGTLVHKQLSNKAKEKNVLRIGHPSGIIEVDARLKENTKEIKFEKISYVRTARLILEGTVYVQNSRLI